MPMERAQRSRTVNIVLCAVVCAMALGAACGEALAARPPSPKGQDREAVAASAKSGSHITGLAIAGSQPAGTFAGVAYRRLWGTVFGIVTPRDAIIGFDQLKLNADGNYEYESEFEIIEPEKLGTNAAIVVESENRGNPIFLDALNDVSEAGPPSATTTGEDPGNGFLFEHATSYARVQWQTGIAPSVPENAEGVGEVMMRDFGRLLAGRAQPDTKPAIELGTYHTPILGGISLSGFFIDTFLAEGVNADPATGVVVFQS